MPNSNPFSGFSNIAGGISGITGALGGIGSLLFGSSMQRKAMRYQQKLQMELMQKQQEYARENSLTDYERQRAMLTDSASLQKQGLRDAGINVASLSGGFAPVASTPSTSSPGTPSAPSSPDPVQMLLGATSQIQNSLSNLSQNRIANAQAEQLELANQITKDSLPELTSGSKGRGLKDYVEGKKAGALLPSDVQKGKAESDITSNDLWKSNNESAYASVNAYNTANTMLAQALQAKELYEKAKLDKSMLAEELQLFKDSYEYSLAAAKQNVVNLKKQGVVLDTQADANKASAEASRASAAQSLANKNLLDKKAIAQDIENSINGNPKVKEAARQRLINIARQAGPQNFSEYAWSVFNDDKATTSQKWKATGALLLSFFGSAIGSAASSAGKAAGNAAGNAAALNAIVP